MLQLWAANCDSDIMSNCLHVTTTIVLPPLSLKVLEIPY